MSEGGEQQNEKFLGLIQATDETLRPAPLVDTITVTETVYHQVAGEQPTAESNQFSRRLETSEQPYVRKIRVGEAWQPLDLGWVEQPGMVWLVNDEGRHFQTNPTPEERAAIEAKVIEVVTKVVNAGPIAGILAEDSFSWEVAPGESFRGKPTDAKRVWLRCRSGTARATLRVYPA
jgi:hypothetical protein